MMSLRENYEQTVENQVHDLKERLGHLARESERARDRPAEELDWQLKWLELKMDRIQMHFQNLKTAETPQWTVIRREIEDLLENLRKALQSASERLS
jgi:hypothetical protein